MIYKRPDLDFEWQEAKRYPFLKSLGRNGWKELASTNFRIMHFNSIKKYLGNVDLDFDSLDESKKARFEKAFSNGVIEIPIAMQLKENLFELIAGNTRIAGLVKNKINPKIWVIDVSDVIGNEIIDMENIDECWDGYKEIGGKMKNGKMVPNCVPKNKKQANELWVREEDPIDNDLEDPDDDDDVKKPKPKPKHRNEANSPAQQAAIAIAKKKEHKESYGEIDEGENKPTKPELWSRAKSMAKSKFDVYPSAYANGWAAKWYKQHGGGWRKKSTNESEETLDEDLRRWFKEKWVDVSKKVDGKYAPCGRKEADDKAYPKCRPSKKVSKETPKIASSYDKDEKKAMTQQKRRAEKDNPKSGKGNKPTMTHFDEATDAGSSGAFVTAMDSPIKRPVAGMANVKKYNKPEDVNEALDASASGQYDTPFGGGGPRGRKNPLKIDGPESIYKNRAVKDKKFPKWGGPGGVFVKIKDKCKKFPYCNQGDINAIEILHEAIQETAKKHGFSTDQVEKLVLNEIKKIFIEYEK